MISRRFVLGAAAPALYISAAAAQTPPTAFDTNFKSEIATCEKASGGRLGVAILNTANGDSFAWRGDERFPFCSSFKYLLAAAFLQRIDRAQDSPTRRITIARENLLSHSPFSEKHTGNNPATVLELCAAMVMFSDNGATNAMLAQLGGPPAFTQFVRTLGDTVTRLDRTEMALNEAIPGDPRDTTSPRVMLHSLQQVTLGQTLSSESRKLLIGWMIDCQTGLDRLRGGLPANWRAGDKTGLNDKGTCNDLAIIWPPGRPPVLITSYLTAAKVDLDHQVATHARIARALVQALK
jgi:beta-lactamase class A